MGTIEMTRGLAPAAARRLVKAGLKLSHGVYFVGAPKDEPPPLIDRARAALAVCPPGSAICDITLLNLCLVTIPEGLEGQANGPIHVLVPPGATGPRRPEIIVHREQSMPPTFYSSKNDVSGVCVEHCWAQVVRRSLAGPFEPFRPATEPSQRGQFVRGRKQALLQCVQLGDALMRRRKRSTDRPPLTSQARFAAHIASLARTNGVRAVRDAFGLVRPRTDSPNETWLRLIVIDAGFPEPAVNHEIRLRQGSRFPDLSWPDRQIASEYQGGHHFDDPSQSRDDLRRRSQLQAAGWIIVEAVYRDLHHPGDLIGRLTEAFSGRPPT
jgi:hypothetical protein